MRRPSMSVTAPMLWTAMSFAGGIVVARHAWRPPLWLLAAIVAMLAAAAVLARRRPALACAAGLAAVAGAGALMWHGHAASVRAPDLRAFDGRQVMVSGWVTAEPPPPLPGRGLARHVIDVQAQQVQPVDAKGVPMGPATAVRAGVRISAYSAGERDEASEDADSADLALRYGQQITARGKLHLPRNFGNPGSFDYRGYLLERGIAAQMATRADRIAAAGGPVLGTRLGALRSRIRRSLLEHVGRLWPGGHAALLQAMLVSERSVLEREARTAYQRTGIYHLIVVSGLNVAIVVGFLYWVLRRLRVPAGAATGLMLLAAGGFAWITDNGAPVWRAALMLAVFAVSRLFYRERALLNSIGTAALALLCVDPAALFGASFQLSFLAVLVIAGIALPVIERTSAPYRRGLQQLDAVDYDIALDRRVAQFRLDLRLVAGRLGLFIPRWMAKLARRPPSQLAASALARGAQASFMGWELLVVSAAMQLCLALPTAYYFHRAVALGLPANLVAVPAAGVLLPAATVAVGLSYLWMPLARLPALLAGAMLALIEGSTGWLWSLHPQDHRVAMPGPWLTVAAAVALLFAAIAVRRGRGMAAMGIAGLLAASLWIGAAPPRPQLRSGVLEITAIDVGQGESIFVVTPEGRTLLLDSGGQPGRSGSEFDHGEDVVSPYLWQRGLTRLDAVAVTHAHEDHAGGMAAVIANFRPRELWLGPGPSSAALQRLLREANARHTQVIARAAGDEFSFGGAGFRVLSPPAAAPKRKSPHNNDSLVLLVRFGETAALLPGDSEKSVELSLARQQVQCDLLQVGHHGSATSTTAALLEAARPRFALVSAGAQNQWGYPRAEVLRRLAAAGVATYRTDTLGALTFYLDGRRVEARPAALEAGSR